MIVITHTKFGLNTLKGQSLTCNLVSTMFADYLRMDWLIQTIFLPIWSKDDLLRYPPKLVQISVWKVGSFFLNVKIYMTEQINISETLWNICVTRVSKLREFKIVVKFTFSSVFKYKTDEQIRVTFLINVKPIFKNFLLAVYGKCCI